MGDGYCVVGVVKRSDMVRAGLGYCSVDGVK